MIHCEMLINGTFVGGPCDQSIGKQVVRAPFDQTVVGTAAEGGWSEANAAIGSAEEAFQTWRHSPVRERQSILRKAAAIVRDREQELAELLCREVAKPITLAKGEVTRLALTFDLAADLLSSYGGEWWPVDYDPRGDGYRCIVERFPIGPILGIVPYNWPYNLAAHKLAPAIATGNTIVLKPSRQAPLSTLTLCRILHEAGAPPGVVNAVNVSSEIAQKMALDQRIKKLSFTGSPPVGWKLKGLVPEKKVSLELGGDASAIVCADADLDWTIPRLVSGSFGYAGQICISIQHVLVQEARYEEVREHLVEATRRCPTGDPTDPNVVCGPLIDEDAAIKVEDWIQEAVAKGAKLLVGGERRGNLVHPAVVEDVPKDARLGCEEVFGPVITLSRFEQTEDAIARLNASPYGIHCGIFTHDIREAENAFQDAQVAGVVVNDYPTLRFDIMPYGGVKRSGFGREGLRYAMDEMTEPKVMLTRTR